jgi:hypothetical protein
MSTKQLALPHLNLAQPDLCMRVAHMLLPHDPPAQALTAVVRLLLLLIVSVGGP